MCSGESKGTGPGGDTDGAVAGEDEPDLAGHKISMADPDAKMIVDTFDPILVSVHQDAFIRFWDIEVKQLSCSSASISSA
jgi:hypothetical protein